MLGLVVQFNVFRRHAGPFITIVYDTGSTGTSFVDGSVEPGTRYIYRVLSLNVVGVASAASRVRVTTDP